MARMVASARADAFLCSGELRARVEQVVRMAASARVRGAPCLGELRAQAERVGRTVDGADGRIGASAGRSMFG